MQVEFVTYWYIKKFVCLFQVEDVDSKFAELKKLKDNNWVDDKPNPVVKKVKVGKILLM